MLVNAKEILNNARDNYQGVAAPDYLDLDSARTFVQTAEKNNTPIILSFAQAHCGVISLEEAAAVGKVVAENVKVPIVLHLDHGQDVDYLRRAIELGFTSVMIDASSLPFEENVAITREVVALAHPHNVTVEAEIGHVGQGDAFSQIGEGEKSDSIYTTVEEAVRFVEETGVDSLAVSIGTCHGLYKNGVQPVLNFERLKELRDAVKVPLVLHGSSGTGDENLRRCADLGITKVNIFTDFLIAAVDETKELNPQDYVSYKNASNQGMAKKLQHYLDLFAK